MQQREFGPEVTKLAEDARDLEGNLAASDVSRRMLDGDTDVTLLAGIAPSPASVDDP